MDGDLIRLCNQGRLKEALHALHIMDQGGIRAHSLIYASLLQQCATQKALPEGKLVHGHMIHRGFNSPIFVGNKLVIMYIKCGSLVHARRVLERTPKRNTISWTVMISAYSSHGQNEEALAMYKQMHEEGIQPNQFTFSGVLPVCAKLEDLERGKKVHQDIVDSGFAPNIFVENALVDMYAKCGSLQDARQVFDKMPKRDVVSWTAMIGGYVQNGHFNEALDLVRQMRALDVEPDSIAYIGALSACAHALALRNGKEIHASIIRRRIQSDVFVGSTLLDMYAKCGHVEQACQVFDKMPERNVVSWNAMISGYAIHGQGKEALQLFEQMAHFGTKPDGVTFVGVLSACCHAGLVDDGQQYFYRMSREYHITPSLEHYSCMVDLFGQAGCLDEAEDLIRKMAIKPDATLWQSLLGACKIHINVEIGERVAERLFELEPENDACYVLLSNIYAAAGRWSDVEMVRKMMKDSEIKRIPGCSWIEINNKVHLFKARDRSPSEIDQICAVLGRLSHARHQISVA